MKTIPQFALLITATWLSSARAETSQSANLAVGSKIPILQLQDGRAYTNVVITKVDDEGVSIKHESGLARIKFDQFTSNYQSAAAELKQTNAPAPARFSGETLTLFQAISSQCWINGDPIKGIADPKPTLDRLAGTSDSLLKEAVQIALALDENQKSQENLGRALQAKMSGQVASVQGELFRQGGAAATAPWHVTGTAPNGDPIHSQESLPLDGIAQGFERSIDGANTQAALNRMSELNIQLLVLSRDLRGKIAELAARDLPKGEILKSAVVAEFVSPGLLNITNRSGKTLRNCLFSTATTMYCPKDESGHQAIANVLNAAVGFSEDFRRESAKQTALRAQLAGAQRGFLVYAPVIRNEETISIPFCDMPSLPDASEVRLSLWTDEYAGVDAKVSGLQTLKDELEAQARVRWERSNAELLRQRDQANRRKNSPLHNGQRATLKPKIPRNPNNPLHQGTGARVYNQ